MISPALKEISDALRNSPRLGEEKDLPEGARYIQISHTAACHMVRLLELRRTYTVNEHLQEMAAHLFELSLTDASPKRRVIRDVVMLALRKLATSAAVRKLSIYGE